MLFHFFRNQSFQTKNENPTKIIAQTIAENMAFVPIDGINAIDVANPANASKPKMNVRIFPAIGMLSP
jgi:hypothetical protein